MDGGQQARDDAAGAMKCMHNEAEASTPVFVRFMRISRTVGALANNNNENGRRHHHLSSICVSQMHLVVRTYSEQQ